ncbi:PAS domain S-box protein [Nitrospina gracilis]|uniref:PAS domain S-box protein n=1 Tax=Nitrospina gracilis TaxID=35801 RepID=UPI001F3FDD3F|nr:PAS domain S-box protein [Nitrospina gracilis]MCF8720914.1 PAS domain S-box-containing protein [Nitrospina gracilis Nb-211]
MSKKNEQIAAQVGITLIVALVLLIVWEYFLKQILFETLLAQTAVPSSFQRWEFIVACLVIVGLSLIIPMRKVRHLLGEIRTVEESLSGEKTLSRIFFNVDNSILIVLDTANQIMQVNKKALKFLGYREEDLLGKDWMTFLIRNKEREALRREFIAFANDPARQFKTFITPVHDKSNKEHRVEWQAAMLKDERDQVYGTIVSGQDVTAQGTLTKEIEVLKTKYEPQIKKLTKELNENKQKYHQEAIKTAHAKARFKFWFDLEKNLLSLKPQDATNSEFINSKLKQVLEDYGTLCDADHGFVNLISEDGETMTNTHIWVSDEPGMEPDPDPIKLSSLPWLKQKLNKKEVLHISKVDELPQEAEKEKKYFKSQGVKSITIVPLTSDNSILGCMGFETIHNFKSWDRDEIEILKIIARQMANILNPSQANSTGDPASSKFSNLGMDWEEDGLDLEFDDSLQDDAIQGLQGRLGEEIKERIASLENARANLESQLDKSKSNEAQLKAAQKELEEKLKTRSQEVEQTQKLLEKEKQGKQQLEAELEASRENRRKGEHTEDQIKALQTRLEEETRAKEELEVQLAQVEQSASKELTAKMEDLEKLRQELEDAKQFKQELQNKSPGEIKTAFTANLEKQLSNKSFELQKVQAKLENELQAKEKFSEKVKREQTALEKKLAEKEAQIEELKARMDSQEKPASEHEYKASRSRTKEKVEEGKAGHSSEKEENANSLKDQIEELKLLLEEKTEQLQDLQNEYQIFRESAPAAEELESTQALVDAKDLEIQKIKETLDEAHIAKNWVETELSILTKDLEKHKENLEVLEASRSLMESEIEELREYQQQLEEKKQEYEELERNMGNLETANQQMLSDLDEKDQLIDDLRKQTQKLDKVDLPMFTINTKGIIMSWNQGAQDLTGYFEEAAQGQPLSFLFMEGKDVDLQRDVLGPLQEKGSVTLILPLSFGTDHQDHCKKGLISLALFKNEDDASEAIGIILDISHDHRAEEELQQAKAEAAEKLQQVLQNSEQELETIKGYYDSVLKKSGLIPITLSTDFEILAFGPEAETHLGWSKDTTSNRNFFEQVTPENDRKAIETAARENLPKRGVHQFESSTDIGGSKRRTMLWHLIQDEGLNVESSSIIAVGQDIHELREKESDIKQREALLSSIIDQAVDGFVTIDESGIIQSFNSTAETMFGYSSTDVMGHNVSILMPEPYRSEHGNYLSRYMQTGKANLVGKEPREFMAQRKDGSTFPIEIAVREIYQGYRRMFVGIIHDVRKRKEFEIASKENEERFRKLMEAEADAIFVVSLEDQKILDGNEAASKLFGYSRGELDKLKYHDLVVNGSVPDLPENMQGGTLGLGPRKKRNLAHFNKKDGTVFSAQVVTSTFIFQNEKLSLNIIRDVTPQIRAEETIQESERHLRDILNQASLPIYIKDMAGRYLLANAAFQKLFNVHRDQLLGKTDHEIFPADIADILAKTDRKALEKSENVETNESILHDDGIHNYSMIKHPMRNSSGVLYGVCGVLNDNTTRNRLESELARMKVEFQERLDHYLQAMTQHHEKQVASERTAAATKVITGLAGQISNPIHGIQNILEQLTERVAMEEIHKGLMMVALNECQRIADLSDRLQRCEIPSLVDAEAIDLNSLLKEIMQEPHIKPKDGSIRFEEQYFPNLPQVPGNHAQLKLAFEHLLQNAVEANAGQAGKIVLATEQADDKIKVHIHDTGCGIPEEIRDRIFDPFFTTKKASKRAGLGLMMVLGVVKNHGGDIDVRSETGKGTTVTLTFPLHPK